MSERNVQINLDPAPPSISSQEVAEKKMSAEQDRKFLNWCPFSPLVHEEVKGSCKKTKPFKSNANLVRHLNKLHKEELGDLSEAQIANDSQNVLCRCGMVMAINRPCRCPIPQESTALTGRRGKAPVSIFVGAEPQWAIDRFGQEWQSKQLNFLVEGQDRSRLDSGVPGSH